MLGDRVARARAPLSVGADGSLTCAAGVRQGSQVAILDGVPKNMVAAARSAAEEAKANLQGAKPAGVLLFDCVCRGMILKDQFQKEIEAGPLRDGRRPGRRLPHVRRDRQLRRQRRGVAQHNRGVRRDTAVAGGQLVALPGIEPGRSEERQILSLLRLPVPPEGRRSRL
jgi:hypothetical protein